MPLVVGSFDEAPSTFTADVRRRVEDGGGGGGGGEFGRGTHADVRLNLTKHPSESQEFVLFTLFYFHLSHTYLMCLTYSMC